MTQPTLGSLFAGIGAIDLGFERAGFKTAWQVEIDPYCRKVLARHFPDAERFEDVRGVGVGNLKPVDVISFGSPCQGISPAGLRLGLDDERSGLFFEAIRIIRELQPKIALMENSAALLGRGMGRVVGALAEIGYDAEWHCIPASHVGAPHNRDRVWIIAYPIGCEWGNESYYGAVGRVGREQQSFPWDQDWEVALREFRGMDDGTSYRVDRVDTIRNSVVPQIPELIARRIKELL